MVKNKFIFIFANFFLFFGKIYSSEISDFSIEIPYEKKPIEDQLSSMEKRLENLKNALNENSVCLCNKEFCECCHLKRKYVKLFRDYTFFSGLYKYLKPQNSLYIKIKNLFCKKRKLY